MTVSCGLIGLPNVGKSSLFNAATKSNSAGVGNFCFCTISPNRRNVLVFNQILQNLSTISKSEKTIFSSIELVDIAGLIKGASQGSGLGNEFLSHIRSVDIIIHVLRCFEDSLITHVENRVDPVEDFQIVLDELRISDIQILEKAALKIKRRLDKEEDIKSIKKLTDLFLSGSPIVEIQKTFNDYDLRIIKELGLISVKPSLCVCNVDILSTIQISNVFVDSVKNHIGNSMPILTYCVDLEQALSTLTNSDERKVLLNDLGISFYQDDQFANLIEAAYNLSNYHNFITSGPKETRSWDISIGSTVKSAARCIHTDFYKKFIRAEVISSSDFISKGGWVECKKAGISRIEGGNYIVQTNDVVLFITG